MSRSVGAAAEQKAAQFLESLGYVVLDRNYRCRMGEIDLVCEEGDVLCFVEVRARRHTRYGLPEETITREKKRRIALTARRYLVEKGITERACRFDVVTIVGEGDPVLQRDAWEDVTYRDG